jgi:predicted amidohydrolase YtcJ
LSSVQAHPPAHLLLRNGRVVSGPAYLPSATALAIAGDRVLAVGSDRDLAALAGPETTVVDLGGRTVIPGLIDGHVHLMRAGQTWEDELHWDGLPTLAEALATVERAAATLRPGEWVRVVGAWHPSQFGERRGPTREELDRLAPHNPVYVQLLYDEALLNRAGMAACGLDRAIQDPPLGSFERDTEGRPTGRVRGLGAFAHCQRAMGTPSLERQVASTASACGAFSRLGLTGAVDTGGIGVSRTSYEALLEARRRDLLTVRTRLYVGAGLRGEELPQVRDWTETVRPGEGDDLVRFTGAGEILSFGCHDMDGLHPFTVSREARSELSGMVRMLASRRWPIHLHATLDTTIDTILDVMEEVDAEHPLKPLRVSLAHVEPISERNLRRAQALGAGLAVQDRMVFRAADAARAWGGEEAVTHSPPLGSMLALGLPLSAGTDATRVTPFNPWLSLWWLVSGRSLSGPRRAPEHRLTRARALELYTRGSAWFSFEEGSRGVLAPGWLADLAVLSADYFTVPEDEIPRIGSELTVLGGVVVHASPAFAGLQGGPRAATS